MDSSPNISVGIVSRNEIDFNLSGKFKVQNENENFFGKCKAKIVNNQIHIKNTYNEITVNNNIVFMPCNLSSDKFDLNDVVIGVNFHWQQKETQTFQGALKLQIDGEKIHAINVLPLENYLISVISSEMNANSSLELLKAHAVISRGWLLAQIEKNKKIQNQKTNYTSIQKTKDEYIRWYDREDHSLFDVCADDHCQRYQGITRAQNPNVIKAVNNTNGKVLIYDHEICDARFSKCCGGKAEIFENAWEPVNHPYLTPVIDNDKNPEGFDLNLTIEKNAENWIKNKPEAFCNTTDTKILSQVLNDYDFESKDFYRWKVEYSQNEISELINKKSNFDFGQIIDLIPIERGESSRLIKLKIVGTKKALIIGKELEIRRLLSKSHLYSSAFTVEKHDIQNNIPQKFILKGAGWGHGVGLCQIGAAVMGHKNYSYEKILYHYFKNTTLEKKY